MKGSYLPKVFATGVIIFVLSFVVFYSRMTQSPAESSFATEEPKASLAVYPDVESEVTEWPLHEYPEVGLYLSAPPGLSVRGELLDEQTFTLYVERSEYSEEEYYQLYGLYNLSARNVNKEDLKSGLEPDSVEERFVGGYPAVSGQNQGQRNRFVTYIITERGLITFSTSEPTQANKEFTDKILKTLILE